MHTNLTSCFFCREKVNKSANPITSQLHLMRSAQAIAILAWSNSCNLTRAADEDWVMLSGRRDW